MSEAHELSDELIAGLRPTGQMAILRLNDDHFPEVTPGGIWLPEKAKHHFRTFQATVVAVGPGARRVQKWCNLTGRPKRFGAFEEPEVKAGDRVLVSKWAAQTGGRSVYLNRRHMLVDTFHEILMKWDNGA